MNNYAIAWPFLFLRYFQGMGMGVCVHIFYLASLFCFSKKIDEIFLLLFWLSLEFIKLELLELCFTCSHVFPGKE